MYPWEGVFVYKTQILSQIFIQFFKPFQGMLQVSRFFYINIYFECFVVLTKANETSYHWLCAD